MIDQTTWLPTFVVFAALAVLEYSLGALWVGLYYRYGLPILKLRVASTTGLIPDIERHLSIEASYTSGPRLIFRRLSPTEIAFREGGRYRHTSRLNYSPVMHGLLRFVPEESTVQVVGWLNWTPVVIVAGIGLIVWLADLGKIFYLVAALVAGLWTALYFTQLSRYRKVARAVTTYRPGDRRPMQPENLARRAP